MKRCDHFKELVLTDYIDRQMDPKAAEDIEGHLLDCSDCRAFFNGVKSNALLFRQTAPQPVPEALWAAVRQRIEAKPRAADPVGDFISQLKGWLAVPRMVPVFASLVIMLLAGSATLTTMRLQQAQDRDQGEYLVSLLGPGSLAGMENNDPGTPIEHYFL